MPEEPGSGCVEREEGQNRSALNRTSSQFFWLHDGLEDGRCAGGKSAVRLEGGIVDRLQRRVDPAGIQQIAGRQLRQGGRAVADTAKLATVAGTHIVAGVAVAQHGVVTDSSARAHYVHPRVQQNVHEHQHQ